METVAPDALVASAMEKVVQSIPFQESFRLRFWAWVGAASRRPKRVTLFTLLGAPTP